VILMFASLTADWLAIAGLRRSESAGPASAWVRTLEISGAIGPWARFMVLGAGLYLAVDAWSWQGWIIVGLVSWVVYVVLGEPLTGRELREMTALVRSEHGKLSPKDDMSRPAVRVVAVGLVAGGRPSVSNDLG